MNRFSKSRLSSMMLGVVLAVSSAGAATESEVVEALTELENHVLGSVSLSGAEIAANKAAIVSGASLFGSSTNVMGAAFDLVDRYDAEVGPLWKDGSPIQSFDRNTVSDEEMGWVVYTVMQTLMDETYTVANVAANAALLDGRRFGSSAHFPGAVDAPASNATHTAVINGSYPDTEGWQRQHDDYPARKPTGCYVAPGSIVTVEVPASIVGAGYQIRVGAHSWDLETRRTTVKRLDRPSILYDIDATEILVGNPLGGGIYVEVPYLADAGVVEIDITGAVRSPYFSSNNVTGHNTTLEEWLNTERNHPAPWADFQTENFMTQVPTDWIYNLDDPVALMADWSHGIDIMNDLMGFPRSRGKETLYAQVDVIMRGGAFFPGYPTGNDTYDPDTDYGGASSNYLVNGPQYAPSQVFHEQGHAYFFKKFDDETESTVNLLHVPIWNVGFGIDLDTSFAASRGFQSNPHRTLDNTAVTWMLCSNFVNGVEMEKAEKSYQLKGYAKYVDIARLFGWQVVNDFHHRMVVDGVKNSSAETDDDLIDRMAVAAGVDVRPLMHFWGIHPGSGSTESETYPASNEIFDLLWQYRYSIPADNAAFQAFVEGWWGEQPSLDGFQTEVDHAAQWDRYAESTAAAITAQLDAILARYFPEGDPDPDGSAPSPDPMGWDSPPAATSGSTIKMVATSATHGNGVQYYFEELSGHPGGDDSGWQDSPVYVDSGLSFNVEYRYRVMARSKTADPVVTAPSPTVAVSLQDFVFEGELGILDLEANGGNNPASGLPWQVGDPYRLVFVTSASRAADDPDLETYDAFVQGLADAAGLGGTWKVIGSSATEDARDHTGTNPNTDSGVPIFLLDGATKVVDDNADLWDNTLDNLITRDELGNANVGDKVATGTTAGGTKRDRYLGGSGESPSKIEYGESDNSISQRWVLLYNGVASGSYRYYALSDILTVVRVPKVAEIGALRFEGGSGSFSWYGETGQTYGLEMTDNLVTGIWQTVTNVVGTNGIVSLTDELDKTNAFYRVYLSE
ncbi:M60 family metallopeptidase [Pontiella sp.]|uniref:M60 family metallopeptidase n=1 Tax=Pontiella sp. TaxID=2837462 RepID=UPI003569B248